MSETTQADVNAGLLSSATLAQMQAAHAAPAPTDPMESAMLTVHDRLSRIEEYLGMALPAVNLGAATVAAVAPQTAPVLSRLGTVESVLEGVLSGIESAFGGKVKVPAPGSVTG